MEDVAARALSQRLRVVLQKRLENLQAEHDELCTRAVIAHCIDSIRADGDGGEKGMDTSVLGGVTFRSVPTSASGFVDWKRSG
jgi:hypothetical protein